MKKYDIQDIIDVSTLGLEATDWLRVAISDINRDLQKIAEKLTERDQNNKFVFTALVTKLEMFEYLADNLVCSQETNLKTYEEEMKEDEGQV